MTSRRCSLAPGTFLVMSLCLSPATQGEDFVPYAEPVPGTDAPIAMVPLGGGTFIMGSPGDEPGRTPAEGPQHEVSLGDFWIGKFEISWRQYAVFVHRDEDFEELAARFPAEASVPSKAWYVNESVALAPSGKALKVEDVLGS